jgi:hypothetical protein
VTDTKLSDVDEVMLRQIHPTFIEDGEPSSQPFRPTPKDENKLSVDRGSKTTPAGAYDLFVASGLKSVAVYGVSVAEFGDQGVSCHPDAIEAGDGIVANPAHAFADYSAHADSKQKTVAKRIKLKAIARGRLHPPDGPAAQDGPQERAP